MHPGVESEFKLRSAHPVELATIDAFLREADLEVTASATRRLGDIYLDDAGMSLREEGLGLRLRVEHGGCTITCKGPAERRGALFVRPEASAPWPSPTTPRTAADLPLELRNAVEPVLLQRPLVPALRLHTLRETRTVAVDGAVLCEIAIDVTDAHGSGQAIRFAEVELEVLEDLPTCERLAAALQARLDLAAAPDDKPTHALSCLGLLAPAAPCEATSLAARLRRHLAAMHRAESALRQGPDPAAVHDLRTATRRLGALVTAFAAAWPKGEAGWLDDHIRALGRELGRLRDLDVALSELPRLAPLLPAGVGSGGEALRTTLAAARARAREHLLEWLGSRQRLVDAQRCDDLLRRAGNPAAIAAEEAERAVAHARDEWRHRAGRAVDDGTARHLHSLRIATRNLRFLLEEFAELLAGRLAKAARRLVRLQGTLGELGDHEAVLRVLQGLLDAPPVPPTPHEAAALGAIAQHLHEAREKLLRRALRASERARKRRFLAPKGD